MEKSEEILMLEKIEQACRDAETVAAESRETVNELITRTSNLNAAKRKSESELQVNKIFN